MLTDEEKQEEREETGWKLVHADVFRPPTDMPMFFCVIVGTGMQLVFCAFFLIVFAAVGFLSPANRGSIMIGMLLLFVLMGAFAGFTSARLYKTFKGKQWQRCTLLTATLFPGLVFVIFFALDMLVWYVFRLPLDCSLATHRTHPLNCPSLLALRHCSKGRTARPAPCRSCRCSPCSRCGSASASRWCFWGRTLGTRPLSLSIPSLPRLSLTSLSPPSHHCPLRYKKDAIEFPVITSNIPRQIPTQVRRTRALLPETAPVLLFHPVLRHSLSPTSHPCPHPRPCLISRGICRRC